MNTKIKKYKPNYFSLRKHKLPSWYDGAKLGIFVHWGLYSIPAFATNLGKNIKQIVKEKGFLEQFKNTPYAEWYLNSIRIKDSEAYKYHNTKYGENFDYYDFIPIFNNEIKNWNPIQMVECIKKSGARYAVIVSKHHDGFLLWKTKYPHPKRPNFMSERDIISDFVNAIRSLGLRLGIYYSGTFDWSFQNKPITDVINFIQNGVTSKEYVEYVNNHWFELIDLFNPDILWNDIGYPPRTSVNKIFAYFYNKNPDGVINDRWIQIPNWIRWILKQYIPRKILEWITKRAFVKGGASMPVLYHCDFLTPEYGVFEKIKKKKWEQTRGIGNSFGYNQFEKEEHYISRDELINMFIDIVSKNGNLLLNIGPKADGSIPEIQKKRLFELGEWLRINGEAIYDTKPWKKAEGKTLEGFEVKFTIKNNNLNIIVLKTITKLDKIDLTIKDLKLKPNSKIRLLGETNETKIKWNQIKKNLHIEIVNIPETILNQPAFSLIVSGI